MRYDLTFMQALDGRQDLLHIVSSDRTIDMMLTGEISLIDLRPKKRLTSTINVVQSIRNENTQQEREQDDQ
jgi:hypothetical protein